MSETELPYRKVNLDTLQVIAHRYYWASQFLSGKKVLEVGCGPGFGLGYLAQHAGCIIGGDITKDSLKLARNHYGSNISLAGMDAHRLPIQDGGLDVVICLAAIIYMNLPTFLDECHRVLKPGGLLLINTPNKNIPAFRPSQLSRNYYSIPELNSLLKMHYFDTEFFGAFTVPQGLAGIQRGLFSTGKKFVGKILKFLKLYEAIKQTVHSEAVVTVPEELEGEMELVKDRPIVPLPYDLPDTQHRIVYIIAQAK
ncbi:MAG: methyltransferase domain-containing protein [Anaerolineae bacterium]|nr:methyltransferase domain-containing protein [Anaerolineae bacterium]